VREFSAIAQVVMVSLKLRSATSTSAVMTMGRRRLFNVLLRLETRSLQAFRVREYSRSDIRNGLSLAQIGIFSKNQISWQIRSKTT
jgi:hypothetical protein